MSLAEADLNGLLGTRIRALRAERGLTLDGLATLAGISRAMLSRVERGESSPTAQLLVKLCGGLGLTMSSLFPTAESTGTPLSRRADQPTWRDPAPLSRYVRRTVSPPGTGSSVEIVEVEFPPGGSVCLDSRRYGGTDQHVWVLKGTLELSLGEQTFRLEGGDCLMMRFDKPIGFRNPTERVVRYAVVISNGAVKP